MFVTEDNGMITIELDGMKHTISRDTAILLNDQLTAAISQKENYLSLKKGNVVYYADRETGTAEKGIIFSIHRNGSEIKTFTVEFPDSNDFDEFNGTGLGHSFFISKQLAERVAQNIDSEPTTDV